MKLEQGIQCSINGPHYDTEQIKQQAYVTGWELVYRKVCKISRCFNKIARSVFTETDTPTLIKKVRNKNIFENN